MNPFPENFYRNAYKGVLDMRAHSQTIAQRPQVGVTMDVGGVEWFRRVCQWFKSATQRPRQIGPVSPYGTWDAQRERFLPMRADGALDAFVSQKGVMWAERLYNASL
jgi:hypothetical protein